MRFCDLKPGDHVVFPEKPGSSRHELIVLGVVDDENPRLTIISVVDEHRPSNVGTIYTANFKGRDCWDAEGDGEVVANYAS